MNNRKYNRIMSRISRLVKRKLNEDVFTDGRYDRYKLSVDDEYDDDELPIIDIDIIDVLQANIVDDDECERLVNICQKSGIMPDTTVEVVIDDNTYEIFTDEELQEALSRIKVPKYKEIISNYVYEEIDRQLENIKKFGFDESNYKQSYNRKQQLDYEIGKRDDYYDSLRKKSLGEKYKFRK